MRLDITGEKYGKLQVIQFSHIHTGKTYWLCKCDCGNEKIVRANDMRSGKTTSCGCNMRESSKRNQKIMSASNKLPEGESSFNLLYAQYRESAKKRKLSFSMTKEQLKQITQSNCYYCGAPPSARKEHRRGNGTYFYNGVDRKDNNIGYEADNLVPCCKMCNIAKHSWPYDMFVRWVKSIYENMKKKEML